MLSHGYYWVKFDHNDPASDQWVVGELCLDGDELFYECGYDYARIPSMIGVKIEPPKD